MKVLVFCIEMKILCFFSLAIRRKNMRIRSIFWRKNMCFISTFQRKYMRIASTFRRKYMRFILTFIVKICML